MASLTKQHTDRELKYIQDAEKHTKEAKKRLATSFTKWKADYLMAGPEFAKAGNSYRLAKEPKLAIDCYMKAATCAEKSGQTYEVGKYQDLAAQILSKSSVKADKIQAAELYEATMNVFMGMEDYMGGATACKKAVSIWSKIEPGRALTMNLAQIDQLEAVGKGTYALEMYRETITLAIKSERWAMAHNVVKKAIKGFIDADRPPSAIYGWHVTEIIVLAKIGDNVALDEAFLESLSTQGYGLSDFGEVAEEINRGVKERDAERLAKVLELRGFQNGLLPIVVNLAKGMWKLESVEEDKNSKKKKKFNAKKGNTGTVKKAVVKPSKEETKTTTQSTGETKEKAPPAVATPAVAKTATTTDEGNDNDMDDLMDGLDDLMSGLPEADDDDDDLL